LAASCGWLIPADGFSLPLHRQRCPSRTNNRKKTGNLTAAASLRQACTAMRSQLNANRVVRVVIDILDRMRAFGCDSDAATTASIAGGQVQLFSAPMASPPGPRRQRAASLPVRLAGGHGRGVEIVVPRRLPGCAAGHHRPGSHHPRRSRPAGLHQELTQCSHRV
jgi:hypothetical protein